MKKLLPLLLLLPLALTAQVTLKGKVNNLAPSALQVAMAEYWNVDHWQQVGILQLENGGMFSNRFSTPVQAQCRIRLAGQNKSWVDFIIPGPGQPDSVLILDLDATKMDGGPARVSGSEENERYYQLMSAYRALNQMRDSTSKATLEQIQEAEAAFNRQCIEMATKFRGTFTGNIVASLLYKPQKQDYTKDPKVAGMSANEFAISHELDKIMFQYEGNLYHNGFVKALNRYYNFFDHSRPEGSKGFIDGVMSRRNGNEPVDLFLFRYLLNKMIDDKDEAGLQHLLTWYLPDCSDDSPLPDYVKRLVESLKECEPGKEAPDLKLPGLDGNSVALSEVCAKNKMTLLLFWKSNCSHCIEFKPILKEIYERYHAQGLEVYAMSLDKTEAGWKTFLQSNPTKWVDVYIPDDQRKEINKQFPIPATPTLISLDRNRKIVSRLILRDHFEAYLQEMLPKMQ